MIDASRQYVVSRLLPFLGVALVLGVTLRNARVVGSTRDAKDAHEPSNCTLHVISDANIAGLAIRAVSAEGATVPGLTFARSRTDPHRVHVTVAGGARSTAEAVVIETSGTEPVRVPIRHVHGVLAVELPRRGGRAASVSDGPR